jgi:hypothetical protein
MSFKRALSASALAAGIGAAGLFGLGLGTASADPWGCDRPGTPSCGDHRDDRGPGDWHSRGVDQGRFDHQPFDWMGRRCSRSRRATAPAGASGSSVSGFRCKPRRFEAGRAVVTRLEEASLVRQIRRRRGSFGLLGL